MKNKKQVKAKAGVNVAELARKAGIEPRVVYVRINNGWTLERAIKTPVRKVKKHKARKVAHKRVAPKANSMIPVEHFVSDRTNMLIGWVFGTIIVVLLTIILSR